MAPLTVGHEAEKFSSIAASRLKFLSRPASRRRKNLPRIAAPIRPGVILFENRQGKLGYATLNAVAGVATVNSRRRSHHRNSARFEATS
jgi:hypothetical protein